MMLAYWFITSLWSSAISENVIYRESGRNVTLRCSCEECLQFSAEYNGMYLYHDFNTREEVLYLHGESNEISRRKRYSGRVQSKGPFMNNSMTISNLTVDDSGVYTCVYKKGFKSENKCNVYTLVVRGYLPCVETPAEEKGPQPVVLIIAVMSCVMVLLLMIIFFILIIPKAKKTCIGRRKAPPEFSVYEDMTRKRFQTVPAAE